MVIEAFSTTLNNANENNSLSAIKLTINTPTIMEPYSLLRLEGVRGFKLYQNCWMRHIFFVFFCFLFVFKNYTDR